MVKVKHLQQDNVLRPGNGRLHSGEPGARHANIIG